MSTTQSAWMESSTAPDMTESSVTLQELNDIEFRRRLAPVIYLAIVMVIGIPGNISVLFIFTSYYKKSTYRVFILALASVDLLACLTSVPFEIIEMRFQYTFYNVAACKCFRANSVFLTFVSIALVLALSFDRYRRVCVPLKWQLTAKTAVFLVGSAVLISLVIHTPAYIVNGQRLVKLDNNITGYDCSTSDRYVSTNFMKAFIGLLLLFFLIAVVSLIVMYVCICRKVYARNRPETAATKSRNDSTSTSFEQDTVYETEMTAIRHAGGKTDAHNEKLNKRNEKSKYKSSKKNISESKANKVTKIAFAISLVFFLSYMPNVLLHIAVAAKGKVTEPTPAVNALMAILLRLVFLNNIANPFIYGFFDMKFRSCFKHFFKKSA